MGNAVTVVRALCLVSALLCMIVGIINIEQRFYKWCPDGAHDPHPTPPSGWDIAGPGDVECIGQWLFWSKGDFIKQNNNLWGWGTVFTFNPATFFDLWIPFVLGLVAVGFQFKTVRVKAISENWPRMCIYYTIMALFGSFPYAGNLGVLAGFFAVFCAFLCFIMAFMHSGDSPSMEYELMTG